MPVPSASVGVNFARSLRLALAQAVTGTIEVHTRREKHHIHVRGGYVAHVDLAGGQEPLGLVLMEHGLLSLPALLQSLRRRDGELYGVRLLRDDFLSADLVMRGLRLQIARRAARLYALDGARFTFQPGAIPGHALATPGARMHPLEVLCLAARHPANAHRSLTRVLCQLKHRRVRLDVPLDMLRRLPALAESFTDADWSALEILAEGCRLSDLLAAGVVPAATASALVEALQACESLAVQGGARTRAVPNPPPAPSRESQRGGPVAEVRLALRGGAEPHRLLGVRPGSPPDALRAAYRRRALELHPDRWASDAPGDLPELFAAVAAAYRTLSHRHPAASATRRSRG